MNLKIPKCPKWFQKTKKTFHTRKWLVRTMHWWKKQPQPQLLTEQKIASKMVDKVRKVRKIKTKYLLHLMRREMESKIDYNYKSKCSHGKSKYNCRICTQERIKEFFKDFYKNNEAQKRFLKNHPEIAMVYKKINKNPKLYPIGNECIFCGRTEKLERGHYDYKNNGYNYITVCHQCNIWMTKNKIKVEPFENTMKHQKVK